ncbi:MAG: LysR family transcriptional regulator [Planctomycetes bacterium]|nr:LysR family transcriptional regulator [Planctomycetota bacterium]
MTTLVQPTLRQLEYLVAVARTLNFREAAEACHVTQPALSAQIQQLEAGLGVTLLERDKRHVRVTAAGHDLVERARSILRDVDELLAAAHTHSRPLTGTLRVGVIPTVAPYLLPHVLPPLRQAHPELRVLLREEQTARLCETLRAGELDVLLLALEADLGDVETYALVHDPFVLAARHDHPLVARDDVVPDDLLDDVVLLLEEGHCLGEQTRAVCAQAGRAEEADVRATSLSTLVQMVAAGLGITLLPSLAIEVEVRAGLGLAVVPFRAPAPGRTIGLAWRRSSPRGEEFALLGETLKRHVPRL